MPHEVLFGKGTTFKGEHIYSLIATLTANEGKSLLGKAVAENRKSYPLDKAYKYALLNISNENMGGVPLISYNPERASKLLNEAGVKGMTYENKEEGRSYLVFDDQAIKILEKFSKRGNGDTTIKNYVAQKDLTSGQKLLQDFGKKIGVRVIFFNNKNVEFHGEHIGGISYLNVNSNMPLGKVFWHETTHWLRNNNPKLYQALAKAAGITDAQRRAYLERTKRNDVATDDEIDEEIISDAFQDVAKMTGLMQSIAGKNRELVERVVQWLQNTMKKFIEYFRNPDGKLTTAQAQKLADEFGKIANELTDSNGDQIFRYNRRTHNIELANGRNWDSISADSTPDNRAIFNFEAKYSISASDNSNESTLQRIRNKLPAWLGSKTPLNERRDKAIARKLSELSGYKIAFGRVYGADDTIVDDFQKIIRTRKDYDWEKMLPQVSYKIANNLGLDTSSAMANYITDWLLTGAPNNISAQATDFQTAARQNPAKFEVLRSLRDDFQEITNMTPQSEFERKVVREKPKKSLIEQLKDGWRGFNIEFRDDLYALQKMVAQIKETYGEEVAAEIEKGIDPYQAAQLYRGKGGVVDTMINGDAENIEEIRNNLRREYSNVNFDTFVTMNMIVEKIGGKKNLAAFNDFLLAKQVKELHEWNKANPEEQYDTPLSEAACDSKIKEYESQFGEAQRDVVNFSNTMLAIMHDAGILSAEKYQRIRGSNKDYAPMMRVFDEDEEYNYINSLKARKGSDKAVREPLPVIIANAYEFIKQAERNKVKCNLAGLARCGGFGHFIEVTEKNQPNLGTTVPFWENGKKKWLVTDKAIVDALNTLNKQSESVLLVKMIHAATSFVRNMETSLNPDYASGNLFRDSADGFIHNKYYGRRLIPFMALADSFRGFIGAGGLGFLRFKNLHKRLPINEKYFYPDKDFIEWKSLGGTQSALVSQDINRSKRTAELFSSKGSKWYSPTNIISKVFQGLQLVAEYSENATRVGMYKRAKNELAKANDGNATFTDMQKAALVSRTATIDFARAGRSIRVLNRYIPFLNATIQGIDNLCRTFNPTKLKTKQGQKEWFSAFLRLSLQGMAMAALQHALVGDKDWYKDKEDWEKETYWFLTDKYRIPKGMDFGIRFTSTLTDEFLNHGIDKFEWSRFKQTLLDAAPNLTSTIATPAFEARVNYSIFRDAPIVPAKEQHLLPYRQYGVETSPFAKAVGETTGFSPRIIDHFINGYFSFLGRFFSGGTDEPPIVRRFTFDPYKNPKSVQDYYETYDKQEKLYNTIKAAKRDGTYKDEDFKDFDFALYKRLERASKRMRQFVELERTIIEDESLNQEQRKEKLQKIEKDRATFCKEILNRAR